jgi:hypothetical protein
MKKSALLVGINNYLHFESRGLKGCVNDTEIVAFVLKTHFGFRSDEITLLSDHEATRHAIVQELKRILETCESNDTIVFYFSGHGSRRQSGDPNKMDGVEETIITHDSGLGPSMDRDIRDSDFRDWIALLAKKTSNIHLFFDSCHSGSMTRDGFTIGSGKARGIETDESREISLSHVERSPRRLEYAGIFSSFSKDSPKGNWLSLSDHYSLLTACRKNELAKECEIVENGTRTYYGAFTYFLMREIIRSKNCTYQDVFEQLQLAIRAESFSQTPQIEGVKTRRPFDHGEIETMKYVLVAERSKDKIALAAGAVHGLTANSEWSVYEPGTKLPLPENKIGYARIVNVGVITTKAKIIKEDNVRQISPGCRAVEEIHYHKNEKKSVYIDAFASELKQIKENIARDIQASSWIKLVNTKDEADFIVSISMKRSKKEAADKLHVDILQADNESILLKMPALGGNEFRKVSETLEKLGRYSVISALENPSSKLAGLIDFTLFQKIKGEWRKAEPVYNNLPQFVEGEQIAFQVRNRSTIPLYVGVLDLGLTKNITLLFPNKAANDRIGAKTGSNENLGILKAGMESEGPITLSIPGETFLHEFPDINKKGGLEIFKLIVTTDQTSLSFNEQPGLTTRGSSDSPLEELLNRYSGNMQTWEAKIETGDQTDWFAINRGFYLFKKPVGTV